MSTNTIYDPTGEVIQTTSRNSPEGSCDEDGSEDNRDPVYPRP